MRLIALLAVGLFASVLNVGKVASTGPETCTWVSHRVNGGQAELGVSGPISMSADGSVVAWSSYNLESTWLTGDRFTHVYVWVRATDSIEEISRAANGGAANGSASDPRLSADGRYVVFHAAASNLVAGDTNNQTDVFRYDRQDHVMTLVGVGDQGQQPLNGDCSHPDISGDGNLVVFQSGAHNLVPGDTTPWTELYLRDIAAGTTTRIAYPDGMDSWATQPRISADGKVVVFASQATTLVPGRNDESLIDVYALVLATGAIERICVDPDGNDATCSYESVWSQSAAISADGRYVSFASNSNNIVANDTNVVADIFRRDRVAGTTIRVSVTNQGIEANSERDSDWSAISADGRFVVFSSGSATLIAGDTGDFYDIFVRDTVSGITERVSMNTAGEPGNAHSGQNTVAISANGRFVAFNSSATNLDPNDGVGQVNLSDIYLYTRNDETASATLSAGESVTTDCESDGSIASDPVETTIQAGADGDYAMTETINTGTPPAGEYWLTREISTTGPLTSAAAPHRVTFHVDASRLPEGFGLADLKVYKDGTRVPENLGATTADPDPCITSRELLENGDLRVVCLASSMGTWDIGDPTYQFQGFVGLKAYPAANDAGAGATIHIDFSIGADIGLDIFRTTPEGALYPISGYMDNPDDPRNFVGGDSTEGSGEKPFTFRRGNYTYAWKTDPSWKGTYRLFTIGLKNGITARLKFKFR